MTINSALNWLKGKVIAEKSDKGSKHIGFDGLVAKFMGRGYTKEQATKIAGKVYWQQQSKKKGKKQ